MTCGVSLATSPGQRRKPFLNAFSHLSSHPPTLSPSRPSSTHRSPLCFGREGTGRSARVPGSLEHPRVQRGDHRDKRRSQPSVWSMGDKGDKVGRREWGQERREGAQRSPAPPRDGRSAMSPSQTKDSTLLVLLIIINLIKWQLQLRTQ